MKMTQDSRVRFWFKKRENRGSCSSSLCLVSLTSLLGHLSKQDASHLILEPFPLPWPLQRTHKLLETAVRLWVSCVFSESLYLRWRMPIAHSIRDLALKMRKILKPGPSIFRPFPFQTPDLRTTLYIMMLLNFTTRKPHPKPLPLLIQRAKRTHRQSPECGCGGSWLILLPLSFERWLATPVLRHSFSTRIPFQTNKVIMEKTVLRRHCQGWWTRVMKWFQPLPPTQIWQEQKNKRVFVPKPCHSLQAAPALFASGS